jgi:phosphohistidine swiveling domain-containing protein
LIVPFILPLELVSLENRHLVGGKAFALSRLREAGVETPVSFCVTTNAYSEYVKQTGIADRIELEINRKAWEDLRWEEIWDASLRIRNLFVRTPVPVTIRDALTEPLSGIFNTGACVVRSSAPDEDSAEASFAGLHESYVNVVGLESIVDHVRLVWASLWSDRALLYRQKLGLDVRRSAMAVLVQKLVTGRASGIAFSRSPQDGSQSAVEAVYGLNQGLVDGTVEPDRWFIARKKARIVGHHAPEMRQGLFETDGGLRVESLTGEYSQAPPLNDDEVMAVFQLAGKAEDLFQTPQDVEWTIAARLTALQSRPITTPAAGDGDDKAWYLTLTRSKENLLKLQRIIEEQVLPGMERDSSEMEAIDLDGLSLELLRAEEVRRKEILDRWTKTYWEYCIPFAHGIRLFGQVYNDRVRPDDPFEFMELLGSDSLISKRRNESLCQLSSELARDPEMLEAVAAGLDVPPSSPFGRLFDRFLKEYGQSSWEDQRLDANRKGLLAFIAQMAGNLECLHRGPATRRNLEGPFLETFDPSQHSMARELLELARASYRLRDDDNIYLGRIKAHWLAVREKRTQADPVSEGGLVMDAPGVAPPHNYPHGQPADAAPNTATPLGAVTIRQLVGQPASPGIAYGPARVVTDTETLLAFQQGEVLVCDAIDPNMTLVAPLAAAIVERRGGMLIHGAIIAREYGLPCVTGVPNAAQHIQTGDMVTVDGHIGLITLWKQSEATPVEETGRYV